MEQHERPHTGGKPPKGPRRQRTVRLPVQHYEVYERRAAEEGLELSDFLVVALARDSGLPVPEWARPRRATAAGESLAIAG